MKWLVVWTVVQISIAPCPQPTPWVDEYGIVHESYNMTLQVCYNTTEKQMEKRFDIEAEAKAFVAGAKTMDPYWMSSVKDFKIMREDEKNENVDISNR